MNFVVVFKRSASSLLAFSIAFFFWEFVSSRLIYKTSYWEYKPQLGSVRSPGKEVFSEEGYSRTSFVTDGLRVPIPQMMPKRRVLVVGDSFTEAVQVSDKETFSQVAQTVLCDSGPSVCLINAGSSGADMARYVWQAKYWMRNYRPAEVVIEVNDRNLSMLTSKAGPFVINDSEGRLGIAAEPPKKDIENVAKRTPVLKQVVGTSIFGLAYRRYEQSRQKEPDQDIQVSVPYTREPGLTRYLDWVLDEYKKLYIHPVILYFPNVDIYGSPPPISELEVELEAACKRNDIALINLRSAFQADYKASGIPAYGFMNTVPGVGHPNAHGHLIAGRELAVYLKHVLR
jgi:hypothetical protein